ncbi:MAG: PAS domain S-box protein [Chloroflexia bacterium]|nr:PAS domain S-box protein [Chloroflexia bacterium]
MRTTSSVITEGQDFIQAALDGLSAHIAVLDLNGNIVAVNKAWCTFADENPPVPVNYGLGTNYFAICESRPDSHSYALTDACDETIPQGIREVIAGELDEFIHVYPCHSPTKLRWFRLRVTRFADGSHLITAHENITQQILAEQAREAAQQAYLDYVEAGSWQLELREKYFRALIEHAVDGIVLVKEDGTLIFASPSARRTFGYAEDEALEFKPIQATHPDDLPRVIEARTQAINHPELHPTIEYRAQHRDGSWRWIETTFTNLLAEPSVAGLLINFRDITERKQAEEDLYHRNLLLHIAGRMARLGGWSVDLSRNRVIWSDEVAFIHDEPAGISPSLDQGLNYYAPEYRERIAELFGACARDGTPYDQELQIITAKGRRVWVRTIGEAVHDAEGKIVLVHGAFQDISERRKAEEQQRAQLAELQRWHLLTLDNEERIIALKREINHLLQDAGKSPRYASIDLHPVVAPEHEKYVLCLYITGMTTHSFRAVTNITAICEEYLKGRYELEIIDLYQWPQLAEKERIIAVPTLVRQQPLPACRIVGDLSDTARVLIALDL